MWELNCKESWVKKNWCFWTVVLEKTLESPWDCKEIQPVHPKGDQSWVFIGRTDVEAKTPILWPPDVKSWLIWKDPDAGEDWRQEEKRTTEDEMVGWHQWLSGHGFGWTLGIGDGQRGLACCSPWGRKESDTEWLNWTELKSKLRYHLTVVRMVIIKKSTNNKFWRGCGGMKWYIGEWKGTLLYSWWKCKLVQPLWRTIRRFLKIFKIELPCDQAIPLLIYPVKVKVIQSCPALCNPMNYTSMEFSRSESWSG